MLPLLLALVAAVAAVPVQNSVVYANAVDFSALAPTALFSCLKSYNYRVVFVRVYNPAGVGSFDYNAVTNIRNAYNNGIGTEVYMTPQPKSNKTAAQQFDETYNGLSSNGITIRQMWLQVVSPANWGTNQGANRNFISSVLVKAQNKGVAVGIYTSAYDWGQITGNSTTVGGPSLWYYKVYGPGVNGESTANFNDFGRFGPFTAASVKQYGQSESFCGMTVNKDVFAASNKAFEVFAAPKQDKDEIFVGGFVEHI